MRYNTPDTYRDPDVRLEWRASSNESAYTLYRAEALSNTAIVGNWTQIPAASQNRFINASGVEFVRVIDADIIAGKTYRYMLVATGWNGGKTAVLSNLMEIRSSTTLPSAQEVFESAATPVMTTSLLNNSATPSAVERVRVQWPADAADVTTATYYLYRSVITTVSPAIPAVVTGPTDANIASASWGSPIATLDMTGAAGTTNVDPGNIVFFYDTAIASMDTRVYYAYKLVASRVFGSSTVYKLDGGSYRIINQAPFVPYANLNINAAQLNDRSDPAYATNLTLNLAGYNTDLLNINFEVQIYFKTASQTVYTPLTSTTGNLIASFTHNHILPQSAAGQRVDYKTEIKFKGLTIYNNGANSETFINAGGRYNFTSATFVPQGGTPSSLARIEFNGQRLLGAPVTIEQSVDNGVTWTNSQTSNVQAAAGVPFTNYTLSGSPGNVLRLRVIVENTPGTPLTLGTSANIYTVP